MKKIFLLGFVLVFLICFVQAEEFNLTEKEQATLCLTESEQIINELASMNFSIQRVNDTLSVAYDFYDSQNLLEMNRRSSDYTLVIEKCDEIVAIKEKAIQARDEYASLVNYFNEVVEDGVNTSVIDAQFLEIETEIKNERYEKALPLIVEGYDVIGNAQAEYARQNLITNAAKGFRDFVFENWKVILIVLAVLLVFFLILRKALITWWLNRKLDTLKNRKEVLKKLVADTQREYFQSQKISEIDYEIRSKNFAELIRDINRQIPLIEEKLLKSKKADKKEGKNVWTRKEKSKEEKKK
jgi:hypothetical protein